MIVASIATIFYNYSKFSEVTPKDSLAYESTLISDNDDFVNLNPSTHSQMTFMSRFNISKSVTIVQEDPDKGPISDELTIINNSYMNIENIISISADDGVTIDWRGSGNLIEPQKGFIFIRTSPNNWLLYGKFLINITGTTSPTTL